MVRHHNNEYEPKPVQLQITNHVPVEMRRPEAQCCRTHPVVKRARRGLRRTRNVQTGKKLFVS